MVAMTGHTGVGTTANHQDSLVALIGHTRVGTTANHHGSHVVQ